MLVPCLAYSSTLKMETICSSETSIDFHRTAWRYIPQDIIIHSVLVLENINTHKVAGLVV
jgi:hypothetical protein